MGEVQADPFHAVICRLLESFTPHVQYIFQKNFFFFNSQRKQIDKIDINEIFNIFPRKINSYSSLIKTVLKIISCSPSFFLSDLSIMFTQLIKTKKCMILTYFQDGCKKIEGCTNEFCFCFSLIFLSDMISQILTKYQKISLTQENAIKLIDCSFDLINNFEQTPLGIIDEARKKVFWQWSVIISIISEEYFTDLTAKFNTLFDSTDSNIITNVFYLFRFSRLDLNIQLSEEFLEKTYKIMKSLKEKNELNKSFLNSVSGLILTSSPENNSPLYSIFEIVWQMKDTKELEEICYFIIALLLLRIPELHEKIDDFFEFKVYPDASDSEKVEWSISLFLYYMNNGLVEPKVHFLEWGVFKRAPTLTFLRSRAKRKSNESPKIKQIPSNIEKILSSWPHQKVNTIEPAENVDQNIVKFMEFFFKASDFSICPRTFCFVLVYLASVDFNGFVDFVLPKFLELDSSDPRLITLLMSAPFINSSDFMEYSSSKADPKKIGEFNQLLRRKVLNILSSLQVDDEIVAVNVNDSSSTFTQIVEESDKKILETLKNWKLSQFSEVNVQHMKAEETVNEFSLEVQLLRALPSIMKGSTEEPDSNSPAFTESIILILLKMTFSTNSSVSNEALSICREMALDGTRFLKIVINYLLERSPSSESLFICISIINDSIRNQLNLLRKQNFLNEQNENGSESNISSLYSYELLYDIELVALIAITSYHPVTRYMAHDILISVNELLHQNGIFSCIDKVVQTIEQIVKQRLFSYSLTDKPSQDQGVLPSGLIEINTALCSHYFDIWSVFLSEIMNVIVESNYMPLILRLRSGRLNSYIKEKVPMVTTFFLSAFFAPELIETISHNYRSKIFIRNKNGSHFHESNMERFLKNNSEQRSNQDDINNKQNLNQDEASNEQKANQNEANDVQKASQNENINEQKANQEEKNNKQKANQNENNNEQKQNLNQDEANDEQKTSQNDVNDEQKANQNTTCNEQKPNDELSNQTSVQINKDQVDYKALQRSPKPRRHFLLYSSSSSNLSFKASQSVPLLRHQHKISRNTINQSDINKALNRINKPKHFHDNHHHNSISFSSYSSSSSFESYSSSSTYQILSRVIHQFLNCENPTLGFIITHSNVTLYPALFDILSSIVFSPSGTTKEKNFEHNWSLINEATQTVIVALRNPSITPIFMIKHMMQHVVNFIAALQGFIANDCKINGPRVIKWTESLEELLKKQIEIPRNYCIIITRLFSIVNSYSTTQTKKKGNRKRTSHMSNSLDCDSDSDYEYDLNLSENQFDKFIEKYGHDYLDSKQNEEYDTEISKFIVENWPFSNREIVFRFLINWSTTTSESLQNLREHAAAALSVIVRVGPLFCDNLLIDKSSLRLFSTLEQEGACILEPLLYNHIDLLMRNYIESCYTEPRNSADLFFEAIFSAYKRIRKKCFNNDHSSTSTTSTSSFFLQQNQKQIQDQEQKDNSHKKVTFDLNPNLSLNSFQEIIGNLILLGLVYTRMNHPRAISFLELLAKIIISSFYHRYSFSLNNRKIKEIIKNSKNLSQNFHVIFAFATEAVIESGFSILSLQNLNVPAKEIIEVIRPWILNLRLLPKQRNCVPGIPNELERFTPYQFLEILMKTTEIIDEENFNSFSFLWSELMKSPDHSELIPLFILKWGNPEINKKVLYQLIKTDAPNIVKRLALHCSFSYYYYEVTSTSEELSNEEEYFSNKMWFVPLITEAFKNQNEELFQHIPTVVHFAFLFNDILSSAHELLITLCQQFSINLKRYINNNNNEYQEYLEANDLGGINNTSFEMTDEILIPVVREFSYILSQLSEEYNKYWGSEALKWLFGCRSLRIARISLTIFNQILNPIEPLVITGICKSVSFHVSNSSNDLENLTKLVGQALAFYNAAFDVNNSFSFEFAVSFLDCKIFVDSCLKGAAQLFLKSLSSNETNTKAWQVIIPIVRPLLNKLENDETNQKVIDLLIKTSQNQELMLIVAPIKNISSNLFPSSPYENFEDLIENVSDILLCKTLVHYATMIETASTSLLNSIYQISTRIVSKVVKNENNRTSLWKIYKSALYNIWICEFALDFVTMIAKTEPSVATKSIFDFYDWNRSLEDVLRSLVRLLANSDTSSTIVPITDCGSIQSVYNLIMSKTVPKILPFVAQQDMLDGMKRVRRITAQKKRRHSLKKPVNTQNAQLIQPQQQINQDQQQILNDISLDFEPLWKPDKLCFNPDEFKDFRSKNVIESQEFVLSDSPI